MFDHIIFFLPCSIHLTSQPNSIPISLASIGDMVFLIRPGTAVTCENINIILGYADTVCKLSFCDVILFYDLIYRIMLFALSPLFFISALIAL